MPPSSSSQNLDNTEKVMYSREDVAQHTREGDIWVIIENDVYDLSSFLQEHPGGAKILQGVAGHDATKKFKKYHRLGILSRYRERLLLGGLDQTTGEKGTSLKSSITSIFRRS